MTVQNAAADAIGCAVRAAKLLACNSKQTTFN
jgi:hypothetical protein